MSPANDTKTLNHKLFLPSKPASAADYYIDITTLQMEKNYILYILWR